ncbi:MULTISPECIES: GNAT family N-acetyltransferase [unclassified Actinoplanes]|uniref:GNAT family N-acetyltransferase n=1 Tax=unclassified Actinoplanes TaxID=2626549 RepID=UPI0002ECCB9C|nr:MULTISPECIES: GNAT family N-acetyltransferase [unclassified Actinoplanes]
MIRVSERHWHALVDDEVAGRGQVSRRPDGRAFVSVDAWQAGVFRRLAETMLAELPRPLYTVVDEADLELLTAWERFGFGPRRREWEYVVPTSGGRVTPPPGVTVGPAEATSLQRLYAVVRAEVEAGIGWQNMPAEVLTRPLEPARYLVASMDGESVGLTRLGPMPRRPHIGLIAVRSSHRGRGIGRAMLAEVLADAHRCGVATASAEVNSANTAAVALFDGFGGRRAGSNLELVLRGPLTGSEPRAALRGRHA